MVPIKIGFKNEISQNISATDMKHTKSITITDMLRRRGITLAFRTLCLAIQTRIGLIHFRIIGYVY